MELSKNNNTILKILQSTFGNREDCDKFSLFQIFFENKLIDVLDCDIFYINSLLSQINPENNKITYENFINLFFFVYTQQMRILNQGKDESTSSIDYPSDLHEMSTHSINNIVGNRQLINSSNNIVKILIDQKEKDKKFFDLCCPFFNTPEIEVLLQSEVLLHLKNFANSIRDKIFNLYCKKDEERNISYINIADLNKIIFDFPIFTTINSASLANTVAKFMYPIELSSEKTTQDNFLSVFDEKLTPEAVKETFTSMYTESNKIMDSNELNFTFSTFTLLLACFGVRLYEDKDPVEAIDYFFTNVLELVSDANAVEEPVIEESVNVEEEDYFPESKIHEEAKRMQTNPNSEDENFIQDCLASLDKDLPEIPLELRSMRNTVSNQANTLFYNPLKEEKVKFPLMKLQVEVDEMNAKLEEERNQRKIEMAKKVKRPNARDPPPKHIDYDDLPNEKLENSKYFAKQPPDNFKQRLIKNSFKDILHNSRVYPSQIKEVLLIPRSVPKEVIETILLALKDQVNGNLELAIRKLERAQYEISNYKIFNTQIELYFNLTFGSIYESLELNLMALKYYFKAKYSSDKSYIYDPDTALVYCHLGGLLLRLREYDWALRCYLKAKDIRENSIGGDTVDTATVYNNLGVCCYHLQYFYPAKGFFQLSFNIYKQHLGTLMIQSNLSKMSQINFNKPFEYKSPGLYNTVTLMVDNPKKKKKK